MDIFRAWVDRIWNSEFSPAAQKLYEHIQSLSLDFFMGGQTER